MSTAPRETPIDLTGQVALVTGGSQGLGRAFALALAAAGAQVAVMARTAAPLAETVQLIERAGGRALAIPGDVSVPDAVMHVVTTAEQQLGPVDLLVNNAGWHVPGSLGYDWEVDPEGWWHTFEINLRGPFLCARAVLPGMIKRKRGKIVNISSGAAVNANPLMDALSVSKAALTHWTRCLAAGTRQHGIAVFAFAPGSVRTPGREYLATAPEVPKEIGDRFRAGFSRGEDIPIERSAQMLLFLVSGRADALSGRYINANQDNEEELVRRAEEIQREDLHILTLRT
jgi:NAD(P)-dependent dehydrogenase (short-subunit alcohol dehydrogenase family)